LIKPWEQSQKGMDKQNLFELLSTASKMLYLLSQYVGRQQPLFPVNGNKMCKIHALNEILMTVSLKEKAGQHERHILKS